MRTRPNILLLVTDDQGAWAMPDRMPELHAPTIARLQQEGLTMEHFFCASPVCSPARASMLNGRMPSAHGIHDWLRPERVAHGTWRAPSDRPDPFAELAGADSLAAALQRSGYACSLVGKWHVGSSDSSAEGYENWWAHQLGGGPYYGAPIWQVDETTGVPARPAVPATEPEYLTDAITREVLGVLERRRRDQDGRPFFLHVAWTAPHDPWDADQHPDDLLALYEDTDFPSVPAPPVHPWARRDVFEDARQDRHSALAGYCASLSGVDRSIAAILAQLEADGELDTTIVVFTSDNGFSCGHHGIWGKGNGTRPLNLWEPSITVPFVVRWPQHVPAGTHCTVPVSATGLLETLVELAGAELRPDRLRAAGSFAPLLVDPDGSSASDARPVVIHDEYGATRMIRTEDRKLIVRRGGPTELYDLAADPGEEHDLSAHPAHAAQRADLQRRLEAWFDAYTAPEHDGWTADVDGDGQA